MLGEEEKNAFIEGVLERVRTKAAKYFPRLGKGEFVAWLLPGTLHSSNPVYVIELNSTGHSKRAAKETQRVFVKYVSPADCAAGPIVEFNALSRLAKDRKFCELGFVVPRPLDHYDDLRALLTEMVEGEKLTALLGRENGRFAGRDNVEPLFTLMQRCGLALAVIHGDGVKKTAPLPADLKGRIDKCTEYLEEKGVFKKGEIIKAVDAAIEKMGVRPLRYVTQHGDYNIGNILVAGEKLIILDFAYAREDLPQNDVARFLMALETFLPFKKNLLFDFGRISAFKERFLDGYYEAAGAFGQPELLLTHLYKLRMILIHFKARHEAYSRQKKSAYLLIINKLYKKRALETLTEIKRLTALL